MIAQYCGKTIYPLLQNEHVAIFRVTRVDGGVFHMFCNVHDEYNITRLFESCKNTDSHEFVGTGRIGKYLGYVYYPEYGWSSHECQIITK